MQEMEQEIDRIDDPNGEINLYCDIIANKVERDDTIFSQMEQWSILSNRVNYIQYDRHPKNYYDLEIKAIDYKGKKKRCGREMERHILNIDFLMPYKS